MIQPLPMALLGERLGQWLTKHKNIMATYDENIWRKLDHGGLIKRVYTYRGKQRGRDCCFPVTLTAQNNFNPDYYACQPLAAMHCLFNPDWVNLKRDLTLAE